jgi:hypothetical protein
LDKIRKSRKFEETQTFIEKDLNYWEFNNSHVLIDFKIDLFRKKELLKKWLKCSGFENFWNIQNSEYVSSVWSRVLPVFEPRFVVPCVDNFADEEFCMLSEVPHMMVLGTVVHTLTE